MTWNPITLRREASRLHTEAMMCGKIAETLAEELVRAKERADALTTERDDLASQRDALMKQVQHLKQPRGPGGQFLGRK